MRYISKLATWLLLQPPKNNVFTTPQVALLTDKKFCEAVLAVYVGCHRDVVLYQQLHRSESIPSFAIT